MSLLSKLFGGGGGAAQGPDPEVYEGFTIFPDPANEGSRHRVGARIEKEVGGEIKTHILIRADTLETRDAAIEASIMKAKQVIDQQGERIFD